MPKLTSTKLIGEQDVELRLELTSIFDISKILYDASKKQPYFNIDYNSGKREALYFSTQKLCDNLYRDLIGEWNSYLKNCCQSQVFN